MIRIISFVVVFIVLVLWAWMLKKDEIIASLQLEKVRGQKDQLVDAKFSVNMDISRASKLQKKIADELDRETMAFQLLDETLDALQKRLKETDRLKESIDQLKAAYYELTFEIKEYERLRR